MLYLVSAKDDMTGSGRQLVLYMCECYDSTQPRPADVVQHMSLLHLHFKRASVREEKSCGRAVA